MTSPKRHVSHLLPSLVLLSLAAVALHSQSLKKTAAQDDLSRSALANLKAFDTVTKLSFTGTATLGEQSGRFTVTVDGDRAELLLPQGFGFDKEVALDRHGSLTCELYRNGKLFDRQSYGVCGYPAPWFYPFKAIATLNRKAFSSTAKRTNVQVELSIMPAGIIPATSMQIAGSATVNLLTRALTSFDYPFLARGSSNIRHAKVQYENFRAVKTFSFPHTITQTVDGATPLVLQIESFDMGAR